MIPQAGNTYIDENIPATSVNISSQPLLNKEQIDDSRKMIHSILKSTDLASLRNDNHNLDKLLAEETQQLESFTSCKVIPVFINKNEVRANLAAVNTPKRTNSVTVEVGPLTHTTCTLVEGDDPNKVINYLAFTIPILLDRVGVL